MADTRTKLGDVVSILYITPDNAVIGENNHFLTMRLTAKNEEGVEETKEYDRIFLHRAFPFDHPESFISVQDAEKAEIGMISDLSVFPEDIRSLLRAELARKYYAPVLTSIRSLRERYGYAYIDATTSEGPLSFTLKDISRSILKVDEKRVMITDIDGNRFDIPDVTKLDRKSYRQLELYL